MNETNVFYEFVVGFLAPFANIMTDAEYSAAVFCITTLCASLFIIGFVSALFGAMNALLALRRK